ncbi:ubiquinone/menaquinone biosynthesis C-methyltransferase UbiE [mine drainage metagenome]|jgi:SAM-dependent methyltransferase|uniref:Ubiquinone/menaquinone biosynthesis C-methyltransferase UbiE n=1 Tax=mine drainage metagenome TaxID=410659 RepID=A0A1J5QS72_9ZZZZ
MDLDALFNDDYDYFYAAHLTPEVDARDVDTVWRALQPQPGQHVLDLACGAGRLAAPLAARGLCVHGVDASAGMLARARARCGDRVALRQLDMRELDARCAYDHAFNWFTSLTYFDDAVIQDVLARVARALRPGGRFAIDLPQRDAVAARFRPCVAVEREGHLMIDLCRFDTVRGRVDTERVVVRDGVRRARFFIRLPTPNEFVEWLLRAGFRDVELGDLDGRALTLQSWHMVAVATR